jgi:hypothetical protein
MTAGGLLAAALLVSARADAADRTLSAAGAIVRLDAKAREVVVATEDGPEKTFVWTPETRITGTMAVGSRVAVRYTAGESGKNVAVQIAVTRS